MPHHPHMDKDGVIEFRRGSSASSIHRRISTVFLLSVITIVLLCLTCGVAAAVASDQSQKYSWEGMDFYDILDLTGTEDSMESSTTASTSFQEKQRERSKVSHTDIRKAYRKQAQKYHPDKIQQKLKKRESNTNSTTLDEDVPTTVEEANARFALIAEAYETLSDEERRREYDSSLRREEEMGKVYAQRQQQRQQHPHYNEHNYHHDEGPPPSSSSYMHNDPRQTFEEFFFGNEDEEDNGWWDDLFSSHTHHGHAQQQRQQQQRPHPNEQPQVYERTETRWDPRLQVEIITVLRKEEFVRSGYFIVKGKDFVQEYGDEYTQISDVYLVEDGFIEPDDVNMQEPHHYYTDHNNYKYGDNNHNHDNGDGTQESLSQLHPGEFMVPGGTIISDNGRFVLTLTNDCELMLIRRQSDEDGIVWSSDTFMGTGLSYQCFLSLHGSQLALLMGEHPQAIRGVIWTSSNEELVPGNDAMGYYYASVDNDGVLAIYRTREEKEEETRTDDHESTNGRIRRTNAARAWDNVQRWTLSKLLHHKSSSHHFKNDTCIWATGPLGCNKSGRRMIVILQRTFQRVDNMLEKFVESLQEGDDDDADLLETLGRVMGKVGVGIGNTSKRMAKGGIQTSKALTRIVKDIAKEQMRKWKRVQRP